MAGPGKHIFTLSDKIEAIPIVHGSGNFTGEVRRRLLASGLDCLAVALPPEYQATVEAGIERLPQITLSGLVEPGGAISYVPVDPTQPAILALRIAMQESVPRRFIDWSTAVSALGGEPLEVWRHPDAYNLFQRDLLNVEKYFSKYGLTVPVTELLSRYF